jgi:hypothetical protein
MSIEEKESFLIAKNREALEHQMQVLENRAVDISEDSMCSENLPHANPPLSLQILDKSPKDQNNAIRQDHSVKEYYVHCPKLFKSASNKSSAFQTVQTEPDKAYQPMLSN